MHASPLRLDAPSLPPSLPPSPIALVYTRDAAGLRAALARLPRPLVCGCGAVEGDAGCAPVGALARPVGATATAVEAVCVPCAGSLATHLVALGAIPRRRPVRGPRRVPAVAAAPDAAVPDMTDVTPALPLGA